MRPDNNLTRENVLERIKDILNEESRIASHRRSKSSKKRTRGVVLSDELSKALSDFAWLERASRSQILRRALLAYVEQLLERE